MYVSYCDMRCELLKKHRIMCCAEGQHCHISHPVRESDHSDENEFNEWVDTHIASCMSVQLKQLKILPNITLTITLMSIQQQSQLSVANLVTCCHLRKIMEHMRKHKHRASGLLKSPVFIVLHIQGHF